MNCSTCPYNTSNGITSVCCELNYPQDCEREIARNLNNNISVEEWFELGKIIVEREEKHDK